MNHLEFEFKKTAKAQIGRWKKEIAAVTKNRNPQWGFLSDREQKYAIGLINEIFNFGELRSKWRQII